VISNTEKRYVLVSITGRVKNPVIPVKISKIRPMANETNKFLLML
jgi:hypothetical protein